MAQDPAGILATPAVRAALKLAWEDSEPDSPGAHEEGGFVLRDPAGALRVVRWPRGTRNSIVVPPHPNCAVDQGLVVATFHTHPNTGPDFLQEPSPTDQRAVRDDPDLKGEPYVGEFVLSQAATYLVSRNGDVSEVADTRMLLAFA